MVGAVGHIERYNPALQSLRERMANGDLGDIYQIATRRQGPFPARIADVGVVKDLATHDIDLTAWLAQSEYVSVAAQVALRSGRPHEDMVAATGKLANGTITNHLVNWLSPMKERVTVVTGEKRRVRRGHADRRPHLLRQRRGQHRVGRGDELPRRVRGRRHPLRDPEA